MPRPIERIPAVMEALQKLWEAGPDLRLGQVMALLQDAALRSSQDPFDIEEDVWLELISEETEHMKAKYIHK